MAAETKKKEKRRRPIIIPAFFLVFIYLFGVFWSVFHIGETAHRFYADAIARAIGLKPTLDELVAYETDPTWAGRPGRFIPCGAQPPQTAFPWETTGNLPTAIPGFTSSIVPRSE